MSHFYVFCNRVLKLLPDICYHNHATMGIILTLLMAIFGNSGIVIDGNSYIVKQDAGNSSIIIDGNSYLTTNNANANANARIVIDGNSF